MQNPHRGGAPRASAGVKNTATGFGLLLDLAERHLKVLSTGSREPDGYPRP